MSKCSYCQHEVHVAMDEHTNKRVCSLHQEIDCENCPYFTRYGDKYDWEHKVLEMKGKIRSTAFMDWAHKRFPQFQCWETKDGNEIIIAYIHPADNKLKMFSVEPYEKLKATQGFLNEVL